MEECRDVIPITIPSPTVWQDDSQSDFAVEVMADVVIPAGDWTIGIGSDDGGKIVIPGVTFEDWQNNDSFEDDEIRFEGIRGHGWTLGSFHPGRGVGDDNYGTDV